MSENRRHLGKKLGMLARSVGLSQTFLADQLGMKSSHINRFFRGHSDVYSIVLIGVLKELGIDIEEIIAKRLKAISEVDQADPNSRHEMLTFLFDELDELGQQTQLTQLLWAAKAVRGNSFPKKIEEKIRNEITLI